MVALNPVGRRRSKDIADSVKLVSLGGTWKQSSSQVELCYDAADSEDIDRTIVVHSPQKQLGCSVPAGAYVVGIRRTRPDFSSKTEVCDFYLVLTVD